jgi:hypothetical protein
MRSIDALQALSEGKSIIPVLTRVFEIAHGGLKSSRSIRTRGVTVGGRARAGRSSQIVIEVRGRAVAGIDRILARIVGARKLVIAGLQALIALGCGSLGIAVAK